MQRAHRPARSLLEAANSQGAFEGDDGDDYTVVPDIFSPFHGRGAVNLKETD